MTETASVSQPLLNQPEIPLNADPGRAQTIDYAIDVRTVASQGGGKSGEAGYWLGGLLRPLRIEMTYGADTAVAVESTTGIFGVGHSPAEAVVDLREALLNHRDELENAGALSVGLQEQLHFLRQHLLPARV